MPASYTATGMSTRHLLNRCSSGASIWLSLLFLVAVVYTATAQDSLSQHSTVGGSLSSASPDRDLSSVRSWIVQQRRKLQQRISQSQPALNAPFSTATNNRRNRGQTVAVASTEPASTPRARRQQRNQQAALRATQQEVPTAAATPVNIPQPAVDVPVSEVPVPQVPVTDIPAPVTDIPAPVTEIPAPDTDIPAPGTEIPAQKPLEDPPSAPVLPVLPELDVELSPGAAGISPSILLMGHFDWQNIPDANGKPWSRCLDMVWRARRLTRGNKLNFVPTHHWVPREDGFGVSRFCYMHKNPGIPDSIRTANGMYCSPWNNALIQEFEDSMTTCFAESFRQGLTPYIRPHLDDGLVKGIWRNGLMFGPNYNYGGYSYRQIMLDPLARALQRALETVAAEGQLWPRQDRQKPVVYLALQGEMSATVMRYTAEWQSIIPDMRNAIDPRLADVKIGIGLNFNALDAVEGGTPPADGGLVGWLVGSGARASRYPVPSIDAEAVNKLVTQDIDFIGISAYAPYTGPGMFLNEFENSAFNVAESLRLLANGVDLAALINRGKVELHYSEFGIGGGNEGNARPAADARMAGKQPWAGVAGYYNYAYDPWNVAELRDYRNEFYSKALQWLADPNLKTYKVCDVFVWGMASWDVFGVYPDSVAYRDLALVQRFADHNLQVVVAQVKAAKDSDNARLVLSQLQAINGGAEGVTSNLAVVNDELVVQSRVNYDAVPAPVPPVQRESSGLFGGWGLFGR